MFISFRGMMLYQFLGFSPQIANTEVTNYSTSARIVFLLTLNGRAVRQVRRLLKILHHRDHYYYIHVDVVSVLFGV